MTQRHPMITANKIGSEDSLHQLHTTVNGVVERKNRKIMNMVRSMLKGRNLSNEYWSEVVACAIYVINRSPTKSVMNREP